MGIEKNYFIFIFFFHPHSNKQNDENHFAFYFQINEMRSNQKSKVFKFNLIEIISYPVKILSFLWKLSKINMFNVSACSVLVMWGLVVYLHNITRTINHPKNKLGKSLAISLSITALQTVGAVWGGGLCQRWTEGENCPQSHSGGSNKWPGQPWPSLHQTGNNLSHIIILYWILSQLFWPGLKSSLGQCWKVFLVSLILLSNFCFIIPVKTF